MGIANLSELDLSELEWQAFCYLTGELPPVDAEAFEMRLAEDESACLALAHITALSLELAAADELAGRPALARSSVVRPRLAEPASMPAPPGTLKVRRPVARGMVLGTAACLCAAVLALLWAPKAPTGLERTSGDLASGHAAVDPSGLPLDDLIGRWSLARVGEELREDEPLLPLIFELDRRQAGESDSECDLCVPDWMMAAVSLEFDETGEPADEVWEN